MLGWMSWMSMSSGGETESNRKDTLHARDGDTQKLDTGTSKLTTGGTTPWTIRPKNH